MAQPNTVGAGTLVGSGVECAPDHHAGQVMGIMWVTQLAKVL